jgi:hypothetical protein
MLGGEAIPLQRFGVVPLHAVALSERLPGASRTVKHGCCGPDCLQGLLKIALSLENLEI